jgi:hypothetical protein
LYFACDPKLILGREVVVPADDVEGQAVAGQGSSRRCLAVGATVLASLAFGAAAHAAIGDSAAGADATTAASDSAVATPSEAVPAVEADAAQVAAETSASDASTLVSPQYHRLDTGIAADSASQEESSAAAPADARASPVESSQPVPQPTTESPSATTNRLITRDELARGASAASSASADTTPQAAPSANPSQSSTPSQVRPEWYRTSHSQYQFVNAMKKRFSTKTGVNPNRIVRRNGVHDAVSSEKTNRLIQHCGRPLMCGEPAPGPRVQSSSNITVPSSNIAAESLLETQAARASSPSADSEVQGHYRPRPGVELARPQYQAQEARYHSRTEPPRAVLLARNRVENLLPPAAMKEILQRNPIASADATNLVTLRLRDAAQQLALTSAGLSNLPELPGVQDRAQGITPEPAPTASSFVSKAEARIHRVRAHAPETEAVGPLTAAAPAAVPAPAPTVLHAIGAARPVTAKALRKIGAIFRPRSLQAKAAAAHLTDSRWLLQIGLALGMAYIAFLGFWFWVTRLRRRGVDGGARF